MPTDLAASAAPPSTRERILEIAQRRFVEQGYEGTSLREIAEELGVTKAALYYHFKSKPEIMRALLEPAVAMQSEMTARLVEATDLDDWAAALDWMVSTIFGDSRVYQLVERNRATLHQLADASEFFGDHQLLHERLEDAIRSADVPFADKVRMTSALAAVVAFDDFGGLELPGATPDTVSAELRGVVRDILRLPD